MKPLQYKVTHWTLDPTTQEERYEPLTDENGEILIFDTEQEQEARAQAMLLMQRQGFDPYSTYFSDVFLVGRASPKNSAQLLARRDAHHGVVGMVPAANLE